MTRYISCRLLLSLALGLTSATFAWGQHGGGAPGGGPGPGGGAPSGNMGSAPSGAPGMNSGPGGAMSGIPASAGARGGVPGSTGARAGLGGAQLGPVGRWWDDKNFARTLGIRPDQKQKMDVVFNSNRPELMQRYQELKTQESRLEEATRETKVSGGSVFAQIDRVAQAREALGAVNARMTDALRKELDADQIARLQAINR